MHWLICVFRTTASTNMNDVSSRSHAIFTIVFTQVISLFKPWLTIIYRGYYMSALVLLNLLKEFGKRDKMRGLPSILSLFLQQV